MCGVTPKYLDGGGVHPTTSAASLNPRSNSQLRCSPGAKDTASASAGETVAKDRSGIYRSARASRRGARSRFASLWMWPTVDVPSARMAVSRTEEVFGDDARSHARSHARSLSRFVGCESDIGPGRVASALASSCRERRGSRRRGGDAPAWDSRTRRSRG